MHSITQTTCGRSSATRGTSQRCRSNEEIAVTQSQHSLRGAEAPTAADGGVKSRPPTGLKRLGLGEDEPAKRAVQTEAPHAARSPNSMVGGGGPEVRIEGVNLANSFRAF
eukprot:scaffold77405_cov33-Phaeocystis_antarctica.AAC.1